ncbi:MAG: CapA family protein [Oscillospiraceae bacterium]|nr:CapA family protein [Oscillospiraceae bacterium]
MAFDPEEFQKRRQQREAQRQEKAAKAKKLRKLALIVGAAVLVVGVLVLVLCLKGCNNTNTPEETQPRLSTIQFAATGDLNVTELVANSGRGEDFTPVFLDIAAQLAHADVTAINLEGGVYGAPYGVDRSTPPGLLEALK